MSGPPPPPPPPGGLGGVPPPPPPSFSLAKSSGTPNRAALLSDIRGGARLRKTTTNDRSAPLVSKSSNSASSNSGSQGSGSSAGSGPAPSPLGLGGLFANGIPKLKPTGSRLLPEKSSSASSVSSITPKPKSTIHESSRTQASLLPRAPNNKLRDSDTTPYSSSPDLVQAKKKLEFIFSSNTAGSTQYSSETSPRKSTNTNRSHTTLHTLDALPAEQNNINRVNKPTPPQKYHTINPRGKSSNNYSLTNNNDNSMPAHKGQAPPPPTQKSALHRSNSQTNSSSRSNLQVRPSPKPPNVKPPPPPKQVDLNASRARTIGTLKNNGPPPPISNSTGATKTSDNRSALHGSMQQQPVKPPAPPRNSSYPNSLSTAGESQSRLSSSTVGKPQVHGSAASPNTTTNHKTIRPPTGPPPPPPNRVSSVASGNGRPGDTSMATSNLHRVNSHKPVAPPVPHHIDVMTSDNLPPPPPPIRNASISRGLHQTESLVSRFKFRDICELPAPPPMQSLSKIYPSQLNKNRRREPPPPPPQMPPPVPAMASPIANGPGFYPDKRYHIQINRNAANY